MNGSGRKHSGKLRAMIAAYVGPAARNATEAARMAGYSCPHKDGYRVMKMYPELFAEAVDKADAEMLMDGRELDERITSLARNAQHRDHFKALELLARMQGKLTDKVNVTIERPALNVQLDDLVRQMVLSRASQQGIAISVQAVEDALPLLPPTTPADKGDDHQPS